MSHHHWHGGVRNTSGRRRWSKLSEWLRPRPPVSPCGVERKGRSRRLLRRHFTCLKSKPLGDISHNHITGIIDGLLDTPSEANRAFTAIRTFFRFAVRRRFISRSPAEGLQIPSRVVARERVLTDHELVKVWNAAVEISYPFGTTVISLVWRSANFVMPAWSP
jgi:hypothetical protein